MLTPTVTFLQKLAGQNNKPWFDANKALYQDARKDFEAFVEAVRQGLSIEEPALREQKSSDLIFRIFRDVRFSKNKTPYKTNFAAYFSRKGRKAPDAGYYFHLEPGEKSFIAAGMWMPDPSLLKAVRQEIDYNYPALFDILHQPDFKKLFAVVEGEQLKRPPQGYTDDHPAIDLLRRKSFIISKAIPDKELASAKLPEKTVRWFAIAKPFVDFLNTATDDLPA